MNFDKINKQSEYEDLVNKGIEFAKKTNFSKAETLFLKAITIKNKDDSAYINLANTYLLSNNLKQAKELLFDYIENYKFQRKIANYLGKICFKYNLDKDLKKLFNNINLDASKNTNEKYYLFFLQGCLYQKNNKFEKSISSFEKSILANSKFFDSYPKILNLFEQTNKINEFSKYINKSLKIFNNIKELKILFFYKSLLLYRHKQYSDSNNLILSEKLNQYFSSSEYYLTKLYDLLSKNYEKLFEYEKAYVFIGKRNLVLKNSKKNKEFNKNIINETILKYKKFYTKENFRKIQSKLNSEEDSKLVFLVGFPRSGTTLLDTILRSHKNITVLEEKPYLLNLRHNFFKNKENKLDSLIDITQNEKNNIRERYLSNIKNYYTNNSDIIIDKLPLSIVEIGFIKTIFPTSKIILALRHPCDVVLSCYFTFFKTNDAMANFLEIDDTINLYNNVFNLFENYEHHLEIKYHQIKYENVVTDFKKEISQLLGFLNLKYEKSLEKFYKTGISRTKINTPSYNQVVNPLYSSSIGRWKKYKKIINTEKKLKKWIEKFNY